MSVKTASQLIIDVNTFLPDNTSELISASDERDRFIDIIDSYLNKTDFFTGTTAQYVAGNGTIQPFTNFISDTAYNATSWNGVTTIAPSKNAVRDEIEAIYSAIAGIDLTPLWNKNGNTLSARGKLGSTSGAYGLDFYVNNVVYGGFSNAGKDYWGGSSAFTDTDHSYYGSGNTNATYNSQWKNSDSTVLGWMRNDGVLYSKNLLVGFSGGFGGDSLSEFWGTTSDNTAFSAKFRASSFDVMAQIRNDGVSAFRSILINPASISTGDDPNVAFSIYGGATDNASVYIAKFRKGDFATVFDIVSNGNLKMGEASDSFGGGEGVFQVGNAQTDASSNPTNAFLLQAKSGRAMVYETDGSLSYLVKAVASTKTTAGAPYTNDGYVEIVVNGTTLKVMTTA